MENRIQTNRLGKAPHGAVDLGLFGENASVLRPVQNTNQRKDKVKSATAAGRSATP